MLLVNLGTSWIGTAGCVTEGCKERLRYQTLTSSLLCSKPCAPLFKYCRNACDVGPCPPGAPQKQGKQMLTNCNSSYKVIPIKWLGSWQNPGEALWTRTGENWVCLSGGTGRHWGQMARDGSGEGGAVWCHGDPGSYTGHLGSEHPCHQGVSPGRKHLIHLESTHYHLSDQNEVSKLPAQMSQGHSPQPVHSALNKGCQCPTHSLFYSLLGRILASWGVWLSTPCRMRNSNLWSDGDTIKTGTWEETSVSHQQVDVMTADPMEQKRN